jgi:hypothetical protein
MWLCTDGTHILSFELLNAIIRGYFEVLSDETREKIGDDMNKDHNIRRKKVRGNTRDRALDRMIIKAINAEDKTISNGKAIKRVKHVMNSIKKMENFPDGLKKHIRDTLEPQGQGRTQGGSIKRKPKWWYQESY